MSAQSSAKSNTALWTLVLLAVPVMYMLSVPVVSALVALTQEDPQTDWLLDYELPYRVLSNNTAMKGILEAYDAWCWQHAGLIP